MTCRRRCSRAARAGPVDLLWGIGGTPEGVLSAAAIKCIGGQLLGRLWPRDEQERQAAIDAGYDLDRVLDCDDLVAGDDCFFSATGVTDGDVLQGVRYQGATSVDDRVAGDALALGDRAAHPRPPRPREAAPALPRLLSGGAVAEAARFATARGRAARASAGTRA